jgi:hypothetical protein
MQRFFGLRRGVVILAVGVVGLLMPGCGGGDDEASPSGSSGGSDMPLTSVEQPVNPSADPAPSLNETQPLTGTPTEQLLGLSLPDNAGDPGKALGRPQSVELPAAQREALSRQLDVMAKAFEAGEAEAIIDGVYPGRRDAVNDLLAHANTSMSQFARALASGKLIAATDMMAEYEIVIDGKAYPVVFVSADDQWFLYAF